MRHPLPFHSPVAFPSLMKVAEMTFNTSKYANATEYLISVSKEVIRKRREAKDAVKVRDWTMKTAFGMVQSNLQCGRDLCYSILMKMGLFLSNDIAMSKAF